MQPCRCSQVESSVSAKASESPDLRLAPLYAFGCINSTCVDKLFGSHVLTLSNGVASRIVRESTCLHGLPLSVFKGVPLQWRHGVSSRTIGQGETNAHSIWGPSDVAMQAVARCLGNRAYFPMWC